MSNYTGIGVIVTPDGTILEDIAVSLVVTDGSDEPWFGTISGDFDPFDLMEGESLLRLPDGREARFRLSRTDLLVPRRGVEIVGLGTPLS